MTSLTDPVVILLIAWAAVAGGLITYLLLSFLEWVFSDHDDRQRKE